ncbi:MAG: N-acetylglucosamine-6-phosphate deacetylase [Actinomycetota bacterium]|nr:N-acetylglucosamine-6-phosphate deacetylase [Actinomycetota bacterium]
MRHTKLLIRAGGVVTAGRVDGPATVAVADGVVAAISAGYDTEPGNGEPVLDASDLTLAPGMIDLHTHGANGAQAANGTPRDLAGMAEFFAAHGVTGFLASVGGDHEAIDTGLRAVAAFASEQLDGQGARCFGAHLEGPFINPGSAGAFPVDTVVAPDPFLLDHYLRRARGWVKVVTIAPELPGALPLIERAFAAGVVCAAGHSLADAAQMERGIEAGIRHVTHMYNAMRPLHHRDPGIVGVALTDDRVTAEVIVDGVHVDAYAVRLLLAAKGVERTAVITDSIGAAGLKDGIHDFAGQRVTVADGAARLSDGALAGSVVTMDQALRTLVKVVGVPLPAAVVSVSETPARVLGRAATSGRIEAGMVADMVALDADLRVAWTMVGGRLPRSR